ncbi:MAG TPA: hypothetical protein VHM01_07445 [Alphaproteobacteria bacterium]|nr:hypothetical protein [Alphaproteobacteria bacterium]
MKHLTPAAALLSLAGCAGSDFGADLGYGVLYTVRCDTGETFRDLNLIHGVNSFDPRGTDGHKYVSITLNGKHHYDYVGRQCDYWPQLAD